MTADGADQPLTKALSDENSIVWCLCHLLQLWINDSSTVTELLELLHAIVNRLHHSALASQRYDALGGEKLHNDTPTRWTSMHGLFAATAGPKSVSALRVLATEKLLDDLPGVGPQQVVMLVTGGYNAQLTSYVEVLAPVKATSDAFGCTRVITSMDAVYKLLQLKKAVEPMADGENNSSKEFRARMHANFDARFGPIVNVEPGKVPHILLRAVLFHPDRRVLSHLSDNDIELVMDAVVTDFKGMPGVNVSEAPLIKSILMLWRQLVVTGAAMTGEASNLIVYWLTDDRSITFKSSSRNLALMYGSIPASAMETERTWSAAGDLAHKKRGSLHPATLAKSTMIRMWLRKYLGGKHLNAAARKAGVDKILLQLLRRIDSNGGAWKK